MVRCRSDAYLHDDASSVEIAPDGSETERPTKRRKITSIVASTASESQYLKSNKSVFAITHVGGVKVVQGD